MSGVKHPTSNIQYKHAWPKKSCIQGSGRKCIDSGNGPFGHEASRWYGPWGSFPHIGLRTLQSSSGHPQLRNDFCGSCRGQVDGCPGKKRLFKENLVFLDFTQRSQSTKYLFALGADLAVIHSPSSLFEIAEQAPQFDDLMICCMTGKQSPQESKNCMHPRDLFSRHPVLFGWRNVRAQSELKRPFRTQQRQEI